MSDSDDDEFLHVEFKHDPELTIVTGLKYDYIVYKSSYDETIVQGVYKNEQAVYTFTSSELNYAFKQGFKVLLSQPLF